MIVGASDLESQRFMCMLCASEDVQHVRCPIPVSLERPASRASPHGHMHFRARCAASRQRENHIARRMGSSVRRADECSRVTWYPASSLTRSHTACPPAHTEARESGESADVTSERAALYVRSACALSRQRATRPSYYHGVGSGAFLMDKAVASSPHGMW